MSAPAKARKRNARGEGGRLREEIVQAATRLIDTSGVEAVTLRAVARQAGISAPSIYDHFADTGQILATVIGHCLGQLTAEIIAARDSFDDPVKRLEAGCEAYLQFAERQPQRYSLVFRYPLSSPEVAPTVEYKDASAIAFATLVAGIADCVAAGRSDSTDPFRDAVALWSAMHGYASLRNTVTRFRWPESQDTFNRIVHGLARVTDPRTIRTGGKQPA